MILRKGEYVLRAKDQTLKYAITKIKKKRKCNSNYHKQLRIKYECIKYTKNSKCWSFRVFLNLMITQQI